MLKPDEDVHLLLLEPGHPPRSVVEEGLGALAIPVSIRVFVGVAVFEEGRFAITEGVEASGLVMVTVLCAKLFALSQVHVIYVVWCSSIVPKLGNRNSYLGLLPPLFFGPRTPPNTPPITAANTNTETISSTSRKVVLRSPHVRSGAISCGYEYDVLFSGCFCSTPPATGGG